MMAKNKKITRTIKDKNKQAGRPECLYYCYNYWRHHHKYQFFIAIMISIIIVIVIFAAFLKQCRLGTRSHFENGYFSMRFDLPFAL